MKTNIFNLLLFAMILLAFTMGCKKDEAEKITFTDYSLIAPADQLSLAITQGSTATLSFKWNKTVASDNTAPFYTIIFDKMEGDFSKPLYKITSDRFGTSDSCAVSPKELNKAAEACGIKQLSSGKIKWKIVASNGVNATTSSDFRILELQRPDGYANSPQKLYLYGDATEAGNNLNKALPFRRVTDVSLADKKFELYTSLSAGTFKIVDSTSGTPTEYCISMATKLIKDSSVNAMTSPATSKKPYRIEFDFTGPTPKATVVQIEWLGIWAAASNKVVDTLVYADSSTWKKLNTTIKWGSISDERYKIAFKELGNATRKFWGSANKDNATAPGPTTVASYYFMVSNDVTQYDYTYKYYPGTNNAKADVFVIFDLKQYTHKIMYK